MGCFPKTLYYYTSFDTFVKIVESKRLRLSDLTKSNDSAEIIGLKERCKGSIIQGYPIDKFLWLGICFSENKDDLHIWATYASKGVSIGFDVQKLIAWTRSIRHNDGAIEYDQTHSNFRKVPYSLNNFDTRNSDDINLFIEAAFVKSGFWQIEKEFNFGFTFFHFLMPLLFFALHICYGIGTFLGLIDCRKVRP